MSFLNLSNVKDDDGGSKEFSVLPAGKYLLRCNEAEVKDTKAGNGRYIKCQFKVDEGEHENRVVFHNFNIENPNPKAVEIGLGQLKRFLKAAGHFNPDELASVGDLIGLKAIGTVKVKSSEQYGDSNEISYFAKKSEEKAKSGF